MKKGRLFTLGFTTAFILQTGLPLSSMVYAEETVIIEETTENTQEETTSSRLGETHGKTIGEILGQIYGHRHFEEGKKLDWTDSQAFWTQIPELQTFIDQYKVEDTYQSAYNNGFEKGFKEVFLEAYIINYQEDNTEMNVDDATILGLEDGEVAGEKMGKDYGTKYYHSGKNNDWLVPFNEDFTEEKLTNKYHLDHEVATYKYGYFIGFKIAFKVNFESSYRTASMEDAQNNYDIGNKDGRKVGVIEGESAGTIAYNQEKTNDWQSAIMTEEEIINTYRLALETERYRSGFISGYIDSFRENYRRAYRALNMEDAYNDDVLADETLGQKDGAEYGASIGKKKGSGDARAGLDSDWANALPSKVEILGNEDVIRTYSLDEKSQYYKSAFYDGFKSAFERNYKAAYKEGQDGSTPEEDSPAYDDGYNFGFLEGNYYGQRDYRDNRDNDWGDACPDEDDIEDKYALKREDHPYKKDFIDGYEEGFEEGYEEGYRKNKTTDFEDAFQAGLEMGKNLGELAGESFGKRDYYDGHDNEWDDAIPSDRELAKEYRLYDEREEFEDGFLYGYQQAFKESYTSSYRDTSQTSHIIKDRDAEDQGHMIGEKEGQLRAEIDYKNAMSNDWQRALIPDYGIIDKFELARETDNYERNFLLGYKSGFQESYIDTYQRINTDQADHRTDYSKVDMFGQTINSEDDRLSLKIEPGTFYSEAYIELNQELRASGQYLTNFTQATDTYSIHIENGPIKLDKSMRLAFKYAGTKKAGIYELVNGKWLYLSSHIMNGEIYTDIQADVYDGGSYAVFVDDTYLKLTDINGHWAEEQIHTFVRRKYLNGYADGTFKPNLNVSRGEFVIMLQRMLNWTYTYGYSTPVSFKDRMTFGPYNTAIQNAVSRGYIKGHADHTFRPNLPITYQEIEWIIQRIPGNNGFDWDYIANKMLDDANYRSPSFDNNNKHITRAEVVYMLYTLQANKKI